MKAVAFIANEPTPYRAHLNARLAHELAADGLSYHCLYTVAAGRTTMPWQIDEGGDAYATAWFPHGTHGDHQGPLGSYRLFCELRRYLLEHQIRFIVLSGYGDQTRLLLIRWAERMGIPIFVRGDSNLHDDCGKSVARRLAKHVVLRWVAERITGFMAFGSAGRAYFNQYAGSHRPIVLCPEEPAYACWGAGDPAADQERREAWGWSAHRRRILCCGRLVPQKRYDIVLDAFARIAPWRPDWDLVIAGSGPLRQELAQRVPDHLRNRVHWLGFLQADELPAVYRGCHLLAHAAEVEPWGLVINEAVAAGLPVVTTDVVGAAIELVRHRINGLRVPAGDLGSFTVALQEVTAADQALAWGEASASELARWRLAADPVAGWRRAMVIAGTLGTRRDATPHARPGRGAEPSSVRTHAAPDASPRSLQ